MEKEDKIRYSRNILLPEIGEEGQERLLGSCVAIVGCGALGTVSAMYLAGGGVGRLRLADFDTIDISNLQRQLSFTEADLGRPKATTLAAKLQLINSAIRVEQVGTMLDEAGARGFIQGADFVLECSDNPTTKHLISRLCAEAAIPCCIGGVVGWTGQATTWIPGSATYADIFAQQADEGSYLSCALGGVVGPLPGIIGAVEALEAIKYLTRSGRLLTNRLLTVDALTLEFHTFNIA
ncbi:MAG: HesA/MoeB/ThiF family protein [Bacteroidales bacterium]|nr:HesA/MoeB/ThiF family protein [Bacteroidales bacterium]